MAPFFRAEQVGSLIRPPSVLAANRSSTYYGDDVSQNAVIQKAIQGAVDKQLDLGIRPITSGEYERIIFYNGMFENLLGMVVQSSMPVPKSLRTNIPLISMLQSLGITTHVGVFAKGRIEHTESAYASGWEMLKSCLPEEKWKECKLAIPSPTWQHLQLAHGTAFNTSVYSSDREYFLDLAQAYRKEFRFLYDAGLRTIQVDDPNMLFFLCEEFRDGCRSDGIDPDELMDLYIWAHNECLKGLPADLQIGVHFCRGNFAGALRLMSGSYEGIAQKLFRELDYNGFYLEFDDACSGSFEPLKHIPENKFVVLGLVSTKTAQLESIDELKDRVKEAAQHIAQGQGRSADEVMRDCLAVSPQCGFASFARGAGIGMTEEKQWEKLKLVRDLAQQMWPDAI